MMTFPSCRPWLAALALLCPAFVVAAASDTPLADRGIGIAASYTGEAAGNLDGGASTGGAYAGQVFFGGDLDFNKLAGWRGAALHLGFASRHGNNLAATRIGNSTSIQEIYGAQNTRLANLTLEQRLFNNRLFLEAGRTVANIHFLGSELCNYFQTNSACGNPTFVFQTSGFTYWPVSSWGGHARWWFTPRLYAHVGAYEVNPDHAANSDHGFDWSLGNATGVVLPYTFGYKTTAATDRLPRSYEIGGWYDTSDYTDPLRDASGAPAVTSGQAYAPRAGRSGFFARFEQQLTRPDTSERGLIVFGAALAGTSGELVEDRFFELGFVQKGTFAGRNRDTLGYVITLQHYSDIEVENLQLARAAAGGSAAIPHQQILMELSYGIQVTPALRIQPNLHYIIDPDSRSAPSRTQNLPNAFAVGLRFDLQLSPTLQAGAERLFRH